MSDIDLSKIPAPKMKDIGDHWVADFGDYKVRVTKSDVKSEAEGIELAKGAYNAWSTLGKPSFVDPENPEEE